MDTAHQVLTVIEGPVYSLAYDVTTDFLAIAIGSEVQLAREFISNGEETMTTISLHCKDIHSQHLWQEIIVFMQRLVYFLSLRYHHIFRRNSGKNLKFVRGRSTICTMGRS